MDGTKVVGLTGGIASGKSTAAAMLRSKGATIIDADVVARDVVAVGSDGLAAVVAEFGDSILTSEQGLDRKKLGALVFADQDARQKLNRIIHPRIAIESQRRIAAAKAPLVIYEAALIVENGLHKSMSALIVVAVTPEVQLARLMARDSISAELAQERIDSQLPLADKLAVADYVIDNSGSVEQTAGQIDALWDELHGDES